MVSPVMIFSHRTNQTSTRKEIVGTLVRKDPQLSRADSADGCCDYFDQATDRVAWERVWHFLAMV